MSPRTVEGFDADGNPVAFVATSADEANIVTLIGRARTALNTNSTFLALGSPTNAQVLAQVQALTRQSNGLIKQMLGDTDLTGTAP